MSLRKSFLFILLLIVIAITLSPFIYGFYIAISYKTAEIANLSVGYSRNDKIILSETIPAGSKSIYVCGDLKTSRSNYLAISLHDSTEQMFLGLNNTNKPYRAGRFCAEIKSNIPLAIGAYKIIIIDQHDRVGELLFDVR